MLEAGGACGISSIKLLKKNEAAYVVAADMDEFSPSFSLADLGVVIPASSDDKFSRHVREIIEEQGVDIVLPTFEHGHESLSKLNLAVFVTDFKSALLCKDKLLFNLECQRLSLPVPKTRLMNNVDRIDSPVYVKPRVGVGSRNNYVTYSDDEYQRLRRFIVSHDQYLVQELLTGEHWNVDVLVTEGLFKRAIPRKDLKQKEGNCITVSVENYEKLIDFSREVQAKLDIRSPFNLEVFDKDGTFTINEINVRFGGGVIFGALSGVDMVSYLVTGDEAYLGELRAAVYSRYYEEVEVSNPSQR